MRKPRYEYMVWSCDQNGCLKLLKHSLFQNQMTNAIRSWYVSLGMWAIQNVFKCYAYFDLNLHVVKISKEIW